MLSRSSSTSDSRSASTSRRRSSTAAWLRSRSPPPEIGRRRPSETRPRTWREDAWRRSVAPARPCSARSTQRSSGREGTSSYVYLGERVVRGWAIVLILFTALLPCLAVIVDLFARLRRRHIPLAPALRSYRSRLWFWLYAVLLFELFALLGVWDTGADRPLAPELSPGTEWPVVALAVYGTLLAVRLARRTRPAASPQARRRRRGARRPGRGAARAGRALAARRRDEPLLGAVPAAVAPRLDLAPAAPSPARGAPRGGASRRLRRAAPAPRFPRSPARPRVRRSLVPRRAGGGRFRPVPGVARDVGAGSRRRGQLAAVRRRAVRAVPGRRRAPDRARRGPGATARAQGSLASRGRSKPDERKRALGP